MKAKSVMYAAVGAPVVAARKVSGRVSSLREQVSKETANYSEAANETIESWATEGEKVVTRVREGKVVEEISQKVDLDQAKEQVTKLRDQLEDMLATWRHSFRPNGEAGEASESAAKTGAAAKTEKPAAKSGAAKTAAKPAAKKASATKTTKSSTAAKTSSAKTEAAKAKAS